MFADEESDEVQDLHIEDRVIPRQTVASFLNFMENVVRNNCGDRIFFGFPASGIYHDLTRHYFDIFRQSMEENNSIETLELFIEPHALTEFDHGEFWTRVGEAINLAKSILHVRFVTDGNLDFSAVSRVISQLDVVSISIEWDPAQGPGRYQFVENETLRSLSTALANVNSLRHLSIRVIEVTGSIDSLFSELWRCQSLKWMHLSFNYRETLRGGTQLQNFLQYSRLSEMQFYSARFSRPEKILDEVTNEFISNFSRGIELSSSLYKLVLRISNLSEHATSSLRVAIKYSGIKALEIDNPVLDVFQNAPRFLFGLLDDNQGLERLQLEIDPSDRSHRENEEFWDRLGRALKGTCVLQHLFIQYHAKDFEKPVLLFSRHMANARHLRTLNINFNVDEPNLETVKKFYEELSANVSLHTTFFPDCNSTSLEAVTKLNRAGRSYIKDRPDDREKTVNVLGQVKDDLDCLFFHLLENPSFITF